MSDTQKIEREERHQRREVRQERALELHRGRNPRENNEEENLWELGHDQHEEDVEQEVPPKEEELWIEQLEALQLRAPNEGTTLSPLNLCTRIQNIVEDDLRLLLDTERGGESV